MSEPDEIIQIEAPPAPPAAMTPEQTYEINMAAIAANERMEMARIKEVGDQTAEQRRIIALNCALASVGLGHQCVAPAAVKPPADDILRRAASFDTFIETGETRGADVHTIAATPPAA